MDRVDGRTVRELAPGAGLTEQIVNLPDGRRVRTVRAGKGPAPLVVFEAGMSACASEWLVVQRAVAAHARTLSYDRSGYGGSEDDPHRRTLERMAEDLDAVLTAAGENEPVILVAHSWGGPIVRAFAHRHPGRIAGIVFVDASLAAITATRLQVVLGRVSFRITALLVRLGAASLVIRMVLPHGPSPEFSDDDVAIVTRDYASARAMRTGVREMNEVLPGRAALEAWENEGPPDVPVVALQGGLIEKSGATQRFRDEFNRAAAELVARHSDARLQVVEGAGHLIPQERPDVVVDAIRAVLAST